MHTRFVYLGCRSWYIVDHNFNGSPDTARKSSRSHHFISDVFTDFPDCHLGVADHLLSALGQVDANQVNIFRFLSFIAFFCTIRIFRAILLFSIFFSISRIIIHIMCLTKPLFQFNLSNSLPISFTSPTRPLKTEVTQP